MSPSPTRKYTTRRSLSPIALRASSFSPVRPTVLGGKRARGGEDAAPGKRLCTGLATPPTPGMDALDCTFRPVSPRDAPEASNAS